MTPARLPCSWAVANKHSGCESKTAHVEVSTIGGHEYPVEWPGSMCDRGIIALTYEVVRDKATPVTTSRAQVSFTTDNTSNRDM